MKLQSSIEFLTTYSFLFLLIGIILSFLFFFASSPRAIIPTQCVQLGGPSCTAAIDYVNRTAGYSIITFGFVNSESVPINVTGISALVNTANSISNGCTPQVVLPGGTFTCIAVMQQTPSIGNLVNGFYTINGLYCNNALSGFPSSCASGTNVQYGGSFSVTAQPAKSLIFSVLVLQQTNTLQQVPPYILTPNAIPSGYARVQNGAWTSTQKGFAFGTGAYQGSTQFGFKIAPFPPSVSVLNDNGISCSAPYNTLVSLASTVVYVPAAHIASPVVSVYKDDGAEVYYQTNTKIWSNVINGAGWGGTPGGGSLGAQPAFTLTSGINYLSLAWYNSCADGAEIMGIAGLTG